jgi:DNA-binding CsgD family transcriptional regulator
LALASPTPTASLVADLWAQVRAIADQRELDLDLRLLGKPTDIAPGARSILSAAVGAVIESASSASELHHLALELAHQPDSLSVRIEHDGTLDPEARSETERQIFAYYGDIGSLGGTLALSSGRGFGMRLELRLPYDSSEGVVSSSGNTARQPLATAPASSGFAQPLIEPLTRQEEVSLSLLAAGLSNKEIAARMHLGVGTVKFHLAQVYQKLGVQGRGRGAAVARARELGILFD